MAGLQCRYFLVEQIPAALEEIVAGKVAVVDFLDEFLLSKVILILNAGSALEDAPGFAALDGEEHHLPADGEVLKFTTDLGFEVDLSLIHI